MDDQQRKNDFEQSVHESWRWKSVGEDLFLASEFLCKEYNDAQEQVRRYKPVHAPKGVQMLAPMVFLRAVCLENFLKALCVKKGSSVTDGEGILNFKDHGLLELYSRVHMTSTEAQKNVLDKLSDAIYSWGRYPSPKSYKYWRQDIPGCTGVQPIFTWSKEDDTAYFVILSEIRGLLN